MNYRKNSLSCIDPTMVDVDLVSADYKLRLHLLFNWPILDCLRAKLVHDVQVHSSSLIEANMWRWVTTKTMWAYVPGEARVPLNAMCLLPLSLLFSDHKMVAYAPIFRHTQESYVWWQYLSYHFPLSAYRIIFLSAKTSFRTSRRTSTEPTSTKSESVRLRWRNQRTAVEGQTP